MRKPFARSRCIVWRTRLTPAPAQRAVVYVSPSDAAPELAPTPRDVSEAPVSERLRAPFLARRSLARRAVALRLGVSAEDVVIGRASSGAPVIVAPRGMLRLSVAGRGDFCAIALATRPIGVDLEPLGQVSEPAWNILHVSERRALASLAPSERHESFLRVFTAKEAYLKALELGLAREPSEIAIIQQSDDAFSVLDGESPGPITAAQWRRIALRGEEFIVACVVLGWRAGPDLRA